MAASQDEAINKFIDEMFKGLKSVFENDNISVTFAENTCSGKGPGYVVQKTGDQTYSFGLTYYINELLSRYNSGESIASICQDIHDFVIAHIDDFTNLASDAVIDNLNPDNFIIMCMSSKDSRFDKDTMLYKSIGSAVMVLYTTFTLNGLLMLAPVLREQCKANSILIKNSLFTNALFRSMTLSELQYLTNDTPGIYLVQDVRSFSDGFYLTFKPFLSDMCEIMGVEDFYILAMAKNLGVFFTDEAAKNIKEGLEKVFKEEGGSEDDFYIPGIFHYDKKTREVTEMRIP